MDHISERPDHFLCPIADSETVQYTAARARVAEPYCTIEDLVRQSIDDADLDATSGNSVVLIESIIAGLRALHQEGKSGFDFRPNKVFSYPEGIAFTRKNDKEMKYLDMQQSETVRLLLYSAPENITGMDETDAAATELADIWGLGCLCWFILSRVDPQFYVTGNDGKRINLNTYKNPVIALTSALGKGTICPEYLGYCRDSISESLLNDCFKPDLHLRSSALKKLINGELYNASSYERRNCPARLSPVVIQMESQENVDMSSQFKTDSYLIRLFAKTDTGDFEVDGITAFINRLKADEIANLDICVYSIAGPMLMGKSTWANIMDRYLRQCETGAPPATLTYLFQSNTSDNCFPISHRPDGCTQGLWITRDPYVLEGPDGRHLAVFLIDSQGLNICGETLADTAMFLFTNMISSCTIWNIMKTVDRDVLPQLCRLTAGIRSPAFGSSPDKVFQDLIVLVRDAFTGDQEYGWKEGRDQFKKLAQHPYYASDTEKLNTVYRNLQCFLMPRMAYDPVIVSFRLTNLTVLPKFQHAASEFLDQLFNPASLRPFHRNGQRLTCGLYADLLATISGFCQADKILKAERMLKIVGKGELPFAIQKPRDENLSRIIREKMKVMADLRNKFLMHPSESLNAKPIITDPQASPQKELFSEEIRYLNKGTKKLDLNNNGSLSVAEIASLPELQQNPLVQRITDIFDTNLNGEVDLNELIHGVSQLTVKGDLESKLRFLFSVYDIDRDGFIATGELFQVLKMMVGNNLKDQQLQQIVDKTIMYGDKDGDGKISFEEFCSLTGHSGVQKKLFGGTI